MVPLRISKKSINALPTLIANMNNKYIMPKNTGIPVIGCKTKLSKLSEKLAPPPPTLDRDKTSAT